MDEKEGALWLLRQTAHISIKDTLEQVDEEP